MIKEYLKAAAKSVSEQMAANPDISIPVDPDVADFMGAFEETAISEDDLDDDEHLDINEEGDVVYVPE